MPSFEDLCRKLFCSPEAGKRLLLGGLLMFVPILNLFSMGYLYRFAMNFRETGRLELPPWEDWGELFICGLLFFCMLVVFFMIPIFLGWVLMNILLVLSLGILGFLAIIPLSIGAVFAPTFFLSALYDFQKDPGLPALLNWKSIFGRILNLWPSLLLPTLLYAGVLSLGMPLFGFAFFIGFILLIVYTTSVFCAI